MKRSKRVARARSNKSKPQAADAKNDGTITVARLPDWVFLPNAYDHIAIDKLRSATIDELRVDQLVRNDTVLARSLREALVEVYIRASTIRRLRARAEN